MKPSETGCAKMFGIRHCRSVAISRWLEFSRRASANIIPPRLMTAPVSCLQLVPESGGPVRIVDEDSPIERSVVTLIFLYRGASQN
jgi:hypothetical protein